MAEFLSARGARRSANPTYNRWNAPQSPAEASAAALSALMRQPQQAQQAAPQMQRMNETPQNQLGGIDPNALQSMIREQVRAQQEREAVSQLALSERDTQSTNGEVNQTSTQASMGPASPGTMRALKMAFGLGLSGMGLGPMAALLGGAINNPDSSTAPTTALGMSAIRRAVPQLGLIDTLAQMFGVDPITRQVDQTLQAALKPTAPTAPTAQPGTSGVAGLTNWGDGRGGVNFSERGPGGSSGPTDGPDGSYTSGTAYGPGGFPGDDSEGDYGGSLEGSSFGGSGSSGNSGRGGIRGGGSFGEGQY